MLTRHGYVQAFEARRFARREDLHVFLQEPEKSFIMAIRQLDHFDEVGQIADRREGPFDHIQFYLDEAKRLRQLEIDLDL